MAFNLENYETVQETRMRFHAEHPASESRILTYILFQDERRFVVRAEIYFNLTDERPNATGHAEEIVGAGNVNKSSALENGETSAIGRALRNAGYEGSVGHNPSREEMQKVQEYKSNPRKPRITIKDAKDYSDEEIFQVRTTLASIKEVKDHDALRAIWDAQTAYLDVAIDGTTMRDTINERAKEITVERSAQ
jgi:hypothetical protein